MVLAATAAVQAVRQEPLAIQVSASADSYVSSVSPATSFGSAPVLSVARPTASSENWTLITFDLFGKLRPGDRVLEAKMTLVVTGTTGSGWPGSILTARTLNAWSEANTTWNNRSSLAFDTSVNLTFFVSPQVGQPITIDVTKQVARWHSYGGPSNYGTAILMAGGTAPVGVTFASREDPSGNGPVLQVKYSPSPRTVYGYVTVPPLWIGTPRLDALGPAT